MLPGEADSFRVGGVGLKPAVLHPEGIGAPRADHRTRALVGQPGRQDLMGHRHIGAGQAPGPEIVCSPSHTVAVDLALAVGAVESREVERGSVDDRRERVGHRITENGQAQESHPDQPIPRASACCLAARKSS